MSLVPFPGYFLGGSLAPRASDPFNAANAMMQPWAVGGGDPRWRMPMDMVASGSLGEAIRELKPILSCDIVETATDFNMQFVFYSTHTHTHTHTYTHTRT